MAELLPCPFCGGEAFIEVIPPHKHYIATFVADYDGGAFAECTKCSCAISADNEQDAINKWNTRTPKERGADNEDSKTNIDFDMFDFSKLSIDEKFWALVFFIFANCKDVEFIEKIKDKFNIDNEKLKQEMNI